MHTKNLFVNDDGSTLGTTNQDQEYRCIGVAYGWNEKPEYDEKGELITRLTSNDEARANAKLWAAADDLATALQGLIAGMTFLHGDKAETALKEARAALAKAGIA
jgi:hypothetical protein